MKISKHHLFQDLTGLKFGKLTVIKPINQTPRKQYLWLCKCDCGENAIIQTGNLKNGHTKSCGCLKHQTTNLLDLENKRFGKLIATNQTKKPNRRTLRLCICDCGNTTYVLTTRLISGITQSCGCFKLEIIKTINKTHGQSKTAEYRAYGQAKQRCQNPKNDKYQYYGGRGIEFRFNSFQEFIETIGYKPNPSFSLDRINSIGHYEKGNVRWASNKTQQRNKETVPQIIVNGVTKTIAEWSELSGIAKTTIWYRRAVAKWCANCSVNMPVNSQSCIHIKTNQV
jgi:hypothetical protein